MNHFCICVADKLDCDFLRDASLTEHADIFVSKLVRADVGAPVCLMVLIFFSVADSFVCAFDGMGIAVLAPKARPSAGVFGGCDGL